MKILYLYSKIMPYQIPVLKNLVEQYNIEVHVVYWDTKGNAPYVPPSNINVTFYKRTELDLSQLKSLTEQINPDLIFISGWQDKGYLSTVKPYRRKGIPIVVGFDDIWLGNFRQRIGAFIFPFFLWNYYSHAWVSGPRQYEFAKKLGFKDNKILNNLYSGNTELFNKCLTYLDAKEKKYPKNFLFVGRFVPAKAIDVLVKGFNLYRDKYNGDWNLICIGKGELRPLLENNSNIKVYDYLDQNEIIEIISETGAFVLPSRSDVSPLVVHEFAASGLPIILSDNIGNRLLFLIDNFNGFSFKNEDTEDLALKMHKISNKTPQELIEMGKNSFTLSKIHHAKFVAASLMSIFHR